MEHFNIIYSALMGATVAVLVLCSLILYQGGFWAIGQYSYAPVQNGGIRTNRILRMFFISSVVTALLMAAYYT